MPSSRGKVNSIVLPPFSAIVCGHCKSHKMLFNYMEEIFMSYSRDLNHSEKECCSRIFPCSIRRKPSDALSTQTELPYETVMGETGVLVYMATLSPGAESLVGDQRILCPTNGWIVFSLLSSVFWKGKVFGSNLDLAYSRKDELHPNPGLFLLIVIWIYDIVISVVTYLNKMTEINNTA